MFSNETGQVPALADGRRPRRLAGPMPDGFLILDKALGQSSAYALNGVKRLLPRGTKIGHAGTLDPLATGVLVAMIGKCTKLCERVMGQPKRVEATLAGFVGTIQQLPPTFSAMKVGGRRACDRVRDGQTVELKPRAVRIDAIRVTRYEWPTLSFVIDCGRGTYVRSIARDVGAALGVGGYLSQLRRTCVGPFGIERGATIEALREQGIEAYLLPASSVATPDAMGD
jgi:tRNA pseudouridine55 synthase